MIVHVIGLGYLLVGILIGTLLVAARFHRRYQDREKWFAGALKTAHHLGEQTGYERGHADGTQEGLEFDRKHRAAFDNLNDYGGD